MAYCLATAYHAWLVVCQVGCEGGRVSSQKGCLLATTQGMGERDTVGQAEPQRSLDRRGEPRVCYWHTHIRSRLFTRAGYVGRCIATGPGFHAIYGGVREPSQAPAFIVLHSIHPLAIVLLEGLYRCLAYQSHCHSSLHGYPIHRDSFKTDEPTIA
jgi:hypothetical protein